MLKKFNEASCQAWKEFGQNIFAYYAQKSDEQSAKTGCIIFGMAWGTLQSGAILGIKRDDWVIALICMTALIGMSHFINRAGARARINVANNEHITSVASPSPKDNGRQP